jgi:hypothetical protein
MSKALNINIRILIENYRAMRNLLVKKELTHQENEVKKELTHQEWK